MVATTCRVVATVRALMNMDDRQHSSTPRISRRVRRAFDFALLCAEKFDGLYGDPPVWSDDAGCTALEAWDSRESKGKDISCREPTLLRTAYLGKSTLDLHVAMWAAGYAEGTAIMPELQADLPWLPAWVWRAVRRRARRPM